MKLRVYALILAAFTLFSFTAVLMTSAEENADKETHVLSSTLNAFPESLGLSSYSSAHGNNQTRLVVTDTGIYVTCPYNGISDESGEGAHVGLWRVSPDNTAELLFEDIIRGVAAGASSNGWADKDGNIWVVSMWDMGEGFLALRAWVYDPVANQVTTYTETGYTQRGNKFGKPSMVYDKSTNCIYAFTCGGDSGTSYLVWNIFDCSARAWEKMSHYTKFTNGRTDYHYAYPNGKGGFYAINENCPTIQAAKSNIEGMSVYDAQYQLRSRKLDAGYVWQTAHMIYVPDARENKGYNLELIPAEYKVEDGLYPNNYNVNNDIFLDEDTGYLYSVVTLDDINGIPGRQTVLTIYDTNRENADVEKDGVFPLLARKNLYFMYGFDETYSQHFYKDTLGNLYLICMTGRIGEVEIWQMTDNLCSDMKLVWLEDVRGVVDRNSGGNVYSTIIATNRGGSPMGDKAPLIAWGDKVQIWYYYEVDFALLRDILAQK